MPPIFQGCQVGKGLKSNSLHEVHSRKKHRVEKYRVFNSFWLERVQEGIRKEVIPKKGFIG